MAHVEDRRFTRDRVTGKKKPTGFTGDKPWRVRWRETANGPQKSAHFARKIDAERHLVEVSADLQRGVYVDPTAGLVTFEEYAEGWRSRQVHRASTAAQVESHLRRHVYPTLGARQLSSIRRSDVQGLVRALGDQLAPATVENVYRHVAGVFGAAVADRIIAATPCRDVRLPSREPAKVEPLPLDAVERLADAVPAHLLALVLFAAGTGLRQGECFGLTVDRIDFLRRQVKVDRQADPMGTGGFAPLKTKASYRTVPLPRIVVDVMAAHLARFPAESGGLVFVDNKGRPLRRNRFAEVWARARTVAELPEGATFHALRHFYASLLIRHGESVKVVQARLGHASASETLDTYSHLWPDSEDRTREAVDAVLGAAESLLSPRAVEE
jgi:integrase